VTVLAGCAALLAVIPGADRGGDCRVHLVVFTPRPVGFGFCWHFRPSRVAGTAIDPSLVRYCSAHRAHILAAAKWAGHHVHYVVSHFSDLRCVLFLEYTILAFVPFD